RGRDARPVVVGAVPRRARAGAARRAGPAGAARAPPGRRPLRVGDGGARLRALGRERHRAVGAV
ncbi:MAG: hypothetical protein AVDCRST_MAG40-3210, partial [uncultured Gemmatimonadaceae bacterium]